MTQPSLAEQIEAVQWAWAQCSMWGRVRPDQWKLKDDRRRLADALDHAGATLLALEEGGNKPMSLLTPHLTKPYQPGVAAALAATVPGMASVAVPDSPNTCRQCARWGPKSFKRDHRGELKPKRCYKASGLMQGKQQPAVPHQQRACRFFELRRVDVPAFREAKAKAKP